MIAFCRNCHEVIHAKENVALFICGHLYCIKCIDGKSTFACRICPQKLFYRIPLEGAIAVQKKWVQIDQDERAQVALFGESELRERTKTFAAACLGILVTAISIEAVRKWLKRGG